jgi:hypothetical protein
MQANVGDIISFPEFKNIAVKKYTIHETAQDMWRLEITMDNGDITFIALPMEGVYAGQIPLALRTLADNIEKELNK